MAVGLTLVAIKLQISYNGGSTLTHWAPCRRLSSHCTACWGCCLLFCSNHIRTTIEAIKAEVMVTQTGREWCQLEARTPRHTHTCTQTHKQTPLNQAWHWASLLSGVFSVLFLWHLALSTQWTVSPFGLTAQRMITSDSEMDCSAVVAVQDFFQLD